MKIGTPSLLTVARQDKMANTVLLDRLALTPAQTHLLKDVPQADLEAALDGARVIHSLPALGLVARRKLNLSDDAFSPVIDGLVGHKTTGLSLDNPTAVRLALRRIATQYPKLSENGRGISTQLKNISLRNQDRRRTMIETIGSNTSAENLSQLKKLESGNEDRLKAMLGTWVTNISNAYGEHILVFNQLPTTEELVEAFLKSKKAHLGLPAAMAAAESSRVYVYSKGTVFLEDPSGVITIGAASITTPKSTDGFTPMFQSKNTGFKPIFTGATQNQNSAKKSKGPYHGRRRMSGDLFSQKIQAGEKDFRGIILEHTSTHHPIIDVNLIGINFEGAQFFGIEFRDTHIASCDFTDTTFSSTEISNCTIENCTFDRALFKFSTFSHNHISDSSFANITMPYKGQGDNLFKESTTDQSTFDSIRGAGFSNGDLQGLDIGEPKVRADNIPTDAPYWGKKLTGDKLRQKIISGEKDFRGADLSGMNLTAVEIYDLDFSYANLQEVDFSSSILSKVRFEYANLRHTNFSDTYIVDPIFFHAIIRDTLFNLSRFSFKRNSLIRPFDGAQIDRNSTTRLINCGVTKAQLEGAKFI